MELPPGLQEIKDRFMETYANGGLPAVEQMVEDLATEAEGAKAFADAGQRIEGEAILGQDDMSDDVLRAVSDVSHETALDSILGMSRHSFATWLLGVVKEQQ